MQVMYTTAYISCGYRGEPEGLKDPAASIDCGTKYLRDKLDQYNNDNADAVSAYNAGSRAWKTNLANRQYTERVLGCYNAFKAC
jgi:soluble lytic murein transglycosylase-like protein